MVMVIIGWAALVALTGALTKSNGRGRTLGMVLGGLLGVFGLMIAALLGPASRR